MLKKFNRVWTYPLFFMLDILSKLAILILYLIVTIKHMAIGVYKITQRNDEIIQVWLFSIIFIVFLAMSVNAVTI